MYSHAIPGSFNVLQVDKTKALFQSVPTSYSLYIKLENNAGA